VLLATGVPLTLLCSFLLFRFVELPGIALGRQLSKRAGPKLTPVGNGAR
jgi:peptidoglycan/LPS O-acetylase OafA/YrhL